VVVVPTRAAARLLGTGVTRDELYDVLHARLANPPPRLTGLERDVMAQTAARRVAAREPGLRFQLRPGLVAEMLRFHDQLRRQSQQVTRFRELIEDALGSDDLDRAAERTRSQTRFLAAAFIEYERLAAASNALDEHSLRDRLIAESAADPVRHIVVTISDWIAEPEGLYVADFDLLARIPGLERLEIVATDRVLASGFDERLRHWLPEIDEERFDAAGDARPVLVTPTPESRANPESRLPNPEPWFTLRDREEELVAIVRQLKADARRGEAVPLERTAVVFKHPLPYLYMAPEVFGSAGVSYQALDGFPLAAEPTAAALDLVLDLVAVNFTRAALVALLRSPHFLFAHEGADLTRESVSALDRYLSEVRYLGELERLETLGRPETPCTSEGLRYTASHAPALLAALDAARELAPLATARPASQQLSLLLTFWSSHLRPIADGDPLASREQRARAAITGAIDALAAANAALDDPAWKIDDVAIAVRRWIEQQTFAPCAAHEQTREGSAIADCEQPGVHLVDDHAAPYGDFDDIAIVGLVDADWPDRPRRNIFYPPALLKALGWPSEKDRRAAADARFLDLLSSAARRTMVSTVTLDDDALVSPSMQLDEIPRARLRTVPRVPVDDARVFAEEALSLKPVSLEPVAGEARTWADLRVARSPAGAPDYHGSAGAAPARAWSVSAIETYLDCPFKFFAQHVLRLEEEPEDEEVMDPRRQGQFVHEVFEAFFREWQNAGRHAITPDNLDAARELFTEIVDHALKRLPEAEAGLERTRLLGSPAAAGLGDAVFRMEAERRAEVVERLLEKRLDGEFTIATSGGPRTVALRGKADRLDLLADGTFRLIDYKLGWPPNRARALQLPIYGLCAEQRLASHRGRSWTLGEAAYLAFKGPRRVIPLFTSPADRSRVLADAQQRVAETLDAINRGEFPPTPDDVYRCETCSYASVCRKDYVGDV
jgi:RecB family exonuclease